MYPKHSFPYESFIGGWYIDEDICDSLINYFKSNKDIQIKGKISDNIKKGIVDRSIKDSTDIQVDFTTTNLAIFQKYFKCLKDITLLYQKEYPTDYENTHFGVTECLNLQHYQPGGGYKKWHFERTKPSNRVLVFMTYLNTVENGGTEFMYQKLKTPAKKGLTLIWPTDFTHTHRGVINKDKEKYVATGWCSYITDI